MIFRLSCLSISDRPVRRGSERSNPRRDEHAIHDHCEGEQDSEAGKLPSQELLAAMGRYNEELVKAGVLLAGEGLQPSSKGARVRFSGDRRTVIDGPSPRPGADRRLLAVAGAVEGGGHRVGQALPQPEPGTEAEIEIRQVFETEDFGAELTPELREQEARVRAQAEKLHQKG